MAFQVEEWIWLAEQGILYESTTNELSFIDRRLFGSRNYPRTRYRQTR
jgi:hypothetical protein